MTKKGFYLYVQRYLLNFVVGFNNYTSFNTVVKKKWTHVANNQYNTCLSSIKCKLLECKYSTQGVESLHFKQTIFTQEQYKARLSTDLLYALHLKTFDTMKKGVYFTYIFSPVSCFFYVKSQIVYAPSEINPSHFLKKKKMAWIYGFFCTEKEAQRKLLVLKKQVCNSRDMLVGRHSIYHNLKISGPVINFGASNSFEVTAYKRYYGVNWTKILHHYHNYYGLELKSLTSRQKLQLVNHNQNIILLQVSLFLNFVFLIGRYFTKLDVRGRRNFPIKFLFFFILREYGPFFARHSLPVPCSSIMRSKALPYSLVHLWCKAMALTTYSKRETCEILRKKLVGRAEAVVLTLYITPFTWAAVLLGDGKQEVMLCLHSTGRKSKALMFMRRVLHGKTSYSMILVCRKASRSLPFAKPRKLRFYSQLRLLHSMSTGRTEETSNIKIKGIKFFIDSIIVLTSSPKYVGSTNTFKGPLYKHRDKKLISRFEFFKPLSLRVAKNNVHQSLLDPYQRPLNNKILLRCNFFLFFNFLQAYQKDTILLKHKIFLQKEIKMLLLMPTAALRGWVRWIPRTLAVPFCCARLCLSHVDAEGDLPQAAPQRRQNLKDFVNRTLNNKIQKTFLLSKPFSSEAKALKRQQTILVKSLDLNSVQLLRPLLPLTRLDSFYICESLKLPVYPDKSNNQVKFLRNRIRKQILPAIRILLNPQFDTLFCKFSESYTQKQKKGY